MAYKITVYDIIQGANLKYRSSTRSRVSHFHNCYKHCSKFILVQDFVV